MRGNQATRSFHTAGAGVASRRLLALSLLILAFLSLSVASALAGKTHALKTTFGAFSSPSGIAIDQTNGNVFVADGGTSNSIEIFGPEGGAPSGVKATEIEGFAFNGSPSGLAIDNSATSPAKGTLYVADMEAETKGPAGPIGAVEKFTLNPLSEEYEAAGELIGSPAMVRPRGVAVDSSGNVFVANEGGFNEPGSKSVVEFNPAGTEIARIEVGSTLERPSALAFDSAGNLFVQSFDSLGVWKLTANGAGEIESTTTPVRVTVGSPTGIAVDKSTDTLYVAEKTHVDQYATSCTPVPVPNGQACTPDLQFGFGTLGETQRVAIAPNGDIDVVDRGNGKVVVFAAALSILPEPSTEAAGQVKQDAATLNGALSAAEGPPASCEFQYTTKKAFEEKGFASAASAPCSPAGPFTGSAKEAVKAQAGGLSPETAYVYRLLASNENGLAFGNAQSFFTVGKPKILTSSISGVSFTTATLEGTINPNGGPGAAQETTYAFEYVTEKDFQESEWAKAISVPSGGQAIGSGITAVKVAQPLSGLSVFTAYRFRLVAENEAGEETGPERTFATYLEQAAGLPDGRVYEQVTPVDKNGGAPELHGDQAAPDGSGITFTSNGGIPGGEGAQEFPEYLAVRGADWLTQGLLPPASLGSAAKVLGWSEDLSTAYVIQAKIPKDPPTLSERDSATRALRPISTEGKDLSSFTYVASSADNSVALFESDTVLAPGGVAGPEVFNTYAWDSTSGELSLVGTFNKHNELPSKGSFIGANNPIDHNAYNQARHAISTDGSAVFFTGAATGQLYLRHNPTREQSALEGGACSEPELACTLQVSASKRTTAPLKDEKPASFWAATPDGSQAFFTSAGKLTNDANTGAANSQSVELTSGGAKAAGTFTLTFKAKTTAPIAFNASAAEVEAALQALSTVGAGNLSAYSVQPGAAEYSGAPLTHRYVLTFTGTLGGAEQPPLSGSGAGLVGSATLAAPRLLLDSGADLYRYSADSATLTDLTAGASPHDPSGADVQGVLGSSDDGSRVYFAANGVLAAGATPGNCTGATDVGGGSGACNLYLWHDGVTVFIAPMKLANGYGDGADSANWLRWSTAENTARVSADGQTLLFRSQLQLTDYENEGTPELYLYSAPGADLHCVSCNPTGTAPFGAPSLSGDAVVNSHPVLPRNLSSDGRRVFFQTPDKLLAADTNGDAGCPSVFKIDSGQDQSGLRFCQDVYEWEAKGAGSCESESQNGGCLYLISTGTSREPSLFADADQSGDNAFLFTAQGLVGQDADRITDIYDARVGGGIAVQNPPAPPPPCEGEACKGGSTEPPPSQSPGSESFREASAPPSCGPGRHRKHGRCVKSASRHKKKSRHHHRHTGARRG